MEQQDLKNFLRFFECDDEPVLAEKKKQPRMFSGDANDSVVEEPQREETPAKTKPVFAGKRVVGEDGGTPAVSGMTAPAIPHGSDGAPGPILGPSGDCVMPAVMNCNAPAHGPHHRPPHPPRPLPPPAPYRRYLHLVAPITNMVILKKKTNKKSKDKKRRPKNPYE